MGNTLLKQGKTREYQLPTSMGQEFLGISETF